MIRFRPALLYAALENGRLQSIEIAGRQVLLVRIDAEVHAASDICPHAGSSLSMGRLTGDVIQCPLHGIRFRLSDGKVVGSAACNQLSVYATRVRDGVVEVALPD